MSTTRITHIVAIELDAENAIRESAGNIPNKKVKTLCGKTVSVFSTFSHRQGFEATCEECRDILIDNLEF